MTTTTPPSKRPTYALVHNGGPRILLLRWVTGALLALLLLTSLALFDGATRQRQRLGDLPERAQSQELEEVDSDLTPIVMDDGHFSNHTTPRGKNGVIEEEELPATNDDDHDDNPVQNDKPSTDRSTTTPNSQHDVYIVPDFERYAGKRFAKDRRITVDVNFHHFEDVHGMIALNFTPSEIEGALRDVAETWAQGNIYVRFKKSDASRRERLDADRADAYRWWVLAFKNMEKNATKVQQDVELFLRQGASKMTAKQASDVLGRYSQNKGHALLNWIMGIGANPQHGRLVTDVDAYSARFHAWYNGGSDGRGRVFARGGSCGTKAVPSSVPPRRRLCLNWDTSHQRDEFTTKELARILAHELGHQFGLPHPAGGGECFVAASLEVLPLMAQQHSVTVAGTPCSPRNPFAKHARYLDGNELATARTHAARIAERQAQRRRKAKAAAASQNLD